jgi:hypothetical protein
MTRLFLASIATLAILAPTAAGATQYAYPAKGQDAATQAKDQAECSTWATQQTGFDPAKAPAGGTSGLPINSAQTTALVGALASGFGGKSNAALGAASSLLGGGNNTVSQLGGAAVGFLGGGQDQTPKATPAAAPASSTEYDHARAACLTGRGYSVQ